MYWRCWRYVRGSERVSWRRSNGGSASERKQGEERDRGMEEQGGSLAWSVSARPRRLAQGHERQGMGRCLAGPGEMDWVWITKDLEIFGFKWGLFILNQEVLYYMKSYVEFQTAEKNKSFAGLAKAGEVP